MREALASPLRRYLIATGILIVIGEVFRSGRLWSWWFIMALSDVLNLGGLVTIPGTIDSLRHQDAWPLWLATIIGSAAVGGFLMALFND